MNVYVASPLGFAASTAAFMHEWERALADAGMEVLSPWANPEHGAAFARAHAHAAWEDRVAALRAVNMAVGAANATMIRACDAVAAVLDGVDVDSGTASEIGFAAALGKRVFGLRTDSRQTGDNAGAAVNLQVHYFIAASGGTITHTIADLIAAMTRPPQ